MAQFTSVAADFLVSQPRQGCAGPTSMTSKLRRLASSVSNNAINRDLAKLHKNKRNNLNRSNGVVDSLTISAPRP